MVCPFAERVPVVFGSGYSCVRIFFATVSMRSAGMMFPANGWPVGRVVNDSIDLAEVAGAHRQRRHRRQERLPLLFAMPLVVAEEERLVLDQRAAERATELVLREVRFGAAGAVVEKVVRIERVVAVELEAAAVETCWCRT